MATFSKETLRKITDFSRLNSNLLFVPGITQRVVNASGTILAEIVLPEEEAIPEEFGVYDAAQFASVLSHVSHPEDGSVHYDITSTHVVLRASADSAEKINYARCDRSLLRRCYTDKKIEIEPAYSFHLSAKEMLRLYKSARILNSEYVAFDYEDGAVTVRTFSDNPAASTYSVTAAPGHVETTLVRAHAPIRAEFMFMPVADYDVVVSGRGIMKFTADDLTAWISMTGARDFTWSKE